jgi:hypothetical protein
MKITAVLLRRHGGPDAAIVSPRAILGQRLSPNLAEGGGESGLNLDPADHPRAKQPPYVWRAGLGDIVREHPVQRHVFRANSHAALGANSDPINRIGMPKLFIERVFS